MTIPLEDNVSDVIGKAQRGLGISDSQLAERSGITATKSEVCAPENSTRMQSSGSRQS